MSDVIKSQELANEKKGWKGLLVAVILSVFFLGFFYLAVSNEPDYMPSQKNKQHDAEQSTATHQHDGKAMTNEAMQHAESSSEHAH